MQQLDHNSTATIFHERNDLGLFILSVTHGGYIIWLEDVTKSLWFCKDRGIDFSVW